MLEHIKELNRLVPLGPWLELAQKAGVRYVPADFSDAFPVMEMYEILDGDGGEKCRQALDWARREIVRRIGRGEKVSFRYECCSTGYLKHGAAVGAPWGSGGYVRGAENCYADVLLDDPRVFDCTVDKITRVCVRPWIEALRVDGFPVEFRVYFGPDGYQGISSYYPQRDLPEDSFPARALHDCVLYAETLANCGEFPLGFSADFIVQPDGESIFLEGGPPHHNGIGPSAHPCCFAPGNTKGIALAKRPGALEY